MRTRNKQTEVRLSQGHSLGDDMTFGKEVICIPENKCLSEVVCTGTVDGTIGVDHVNKCLTVPGRGVILADAHVDKCLIAPGRGITRANDIVDKRLTESEGRVDLVNGPINLYPFVGIGTTPVKRRIEPRSVSRFDEPSFSREAVTRRKFEKEPVTKSNPDTLDTLGGQYPTVLSKWDQEAVKRIQGIMRTPITHSVWTATLLW